MKTILFILLGNLIFAQKTLVTGTNSNWKISTDTKQGISYTYFEWEYPNYNFGKKGGNNEPKSHIRMTSRTELKLLCDMLNDFALFERVGLLYEGVWFRLRLSSTNDTLYLFDYDGCELRLTKPKTKLIASEIEKNINYLTE